MEILPSKAPFYRLAVVVGGSSAPTVVISGSTTWHVEEIFLSLSVLIKNQ